MRGGGAVRADTCTCVTSARVRSFAVYSVGFVFFVSNVPERCAPERFDIVGASHQTWHVCVAVAAALFVEALVEFVTMRTRIPNYCATVFI